MTVTQLYGNRTTRLYGNRTTRLYDNRTTRLYDNRTTPLYGNGLGAPTASSPSPATDIAEAAVLESESGPGSTRPTTVRQIRREFDQIAARPGLLASLVIAAAGGDTAEILRAAADYQDAIHDDGVTAANVVDLHTRRRHR